MRSKNIVFQSLLAVILAAWTSASTDLAKAQSASDGLTQVEVITSGGFAAALDILGPLFEQATGIEVITEYGSSMGGVGMCAETLHGALQRYLLFPHPCRVIAQATSRAARQSTNEADSTLCVPASRLVCPSGCYVNHTIWKDRRAKK